MGKVLVAYFSASGVTAGLSKRLAEGKRFGSSASSEELKVWAQEWL